MIDPKKEALSRMKRAEAVLYTITNELSSAQALLSVIVGPVKSYEFIDKIREDVKKTIYRLQGEIEGGKCVLDSSTVAVLEKYEANKKKDLKKAQPCGRYTIHLSSVGNPDFAQYAPISNPITVGADSLRELWKKCAAYISTWAMGGGNWTNPKVKENGKPIGYFSYNGRLWSFDKSAVNPHGTEINYGGP